MEPGKNKKVFNSDPGLNRYKQAVDVAYNFLKQKRQVENSSELPEKQ